MGCYCLQWIVVPSMRHSIRPGISLNATTPSMAGTAPWDANLDTMDCPRPFAKAMVSGTMAADRAIQVTCAIIVFVALFHCFFHINK